MEPFLAIGSIAFLYLCIVLIFGEFLDIGDVDMDLNDDVSWFDLKAIAVGLIGLGSVGAIAHQLGASLIISWSLALIGFFVMTFVSVFFVLKPLARQQSNSLISRDSYLGRPATVTLRIPAHGTGQVSFVDLNGARVVESAVANDGSDMPSDTAVIIVDLANDGVVVSENPLAI
ncbi:MAG TPA: hypothetical protein VJ742_13000 [Nitrososphaera sp.]|nr:hypothetical protein [Nitrososphaera sp.]